MQQARRRKGRGRFAAGVAGVLALLFVTQTWGTGAQAQFFDRSQGVNAVRNSTLFGFDVEVQRVGTGPIPTCSAVGGTVDADYCNAFSGADPIFPPIQLYPGDEPASSPDDITHHVVRIRNTNAIPRDATFFMYVDQNTITVRKCLDIGANKKFDDDIDPATGFCTSIEVVPTKNPDWKTFVNLNTVTVRREIVLSVDGSDQLSLGTTEENETVEACEPLGLCSTSTERSAFTRYQEVCTVNITQYRTDSACNLGRIRATNFESLVGISSQNLLSPLPDGLDNHPMNLRHYRFLMGMRDSGPDRAKFRGWSASFNMVFGALVPPQPESGNLIVER